MLGALLILLPFLHKTLIKPPLLFTPQKNTETRREFEEKLFEQRHKNS